MYSISKLSDSSKDFIRSISASTTVLDIITLSIARVVSTRLALPSSAINDTSTYYGENVSNVARDLVSDLNEVRVINTTRVLELVKIFWTIRYNILFPKKRMYLIGNASPESHFFGYAPFINSQLDLEITSALPLFITCYNGFNQILDELNDSIEGV